MGRGVWVGGRGQRGREGAVAGRICAQLGAVTQKKRGCDFGSDLAAISPLLPRQGQGGGVLRRRSDLATISIASESLATRD